MEEADTGGSSSKDRVSSQPGPWSLLLLVSWCGLVAGLLEVAVVVLRKQSFDLDRLAPITRHFVWLIPVSNLAIFIVLSLLLAPLVWWGRRGRWLAARLLCGLTLLPPVWAASPRIFGPAGLVLALGAATRFVPALERRATSFRRLVGISFPAVVGVVFLLAASLWGRDWIKEWRESAAAVTAGGQPQRALDRAGHGGRRPSEPLRLRPSHQPDHQ